MKCVTCEFIPFLISTVLEIFKQQNYCAVHTFPNLLIFSDK